MLLEEDKLGADIVDIRQLTPHYLCARMSVFNDSDYFVPFPLWRERGGGALCIDLPSSHLTLGNESKFPLLSLNR